jgi:hypothetical protein
LRESITYSLSWKVQGIWHVFVWKRRGKTSFTGDSITISDIIRGYENQCVFLHPLSLLREISCWFSVALFTTPRIGIETDSNRGERV